MEKQTTDLLNAIKTGHFGSMIVLGKTGEGKKTAIRSGLGAVLPSRSKSAKARSVG